MAMSKQSSVEQKSLLIGAIEFLKKADQSEQLLSDLALDNSVFIKSSHFYHQFTGKTPDHIHPMNLLA